MTEWSTSITFAVAIIILAATIGLGLSNVAVTNQAGQEISDNLDKKVQSSGTYTSQINVPKQDYATAQVTLRSVLCSTPCYIQVNGKKYMYFNLYDGVSLNGSGQITGKVGATNLSTDIFKYMSQESGGRNKTYTFSTGSDANLIKQHGSYILMEEG